VTEGSDMTLFKRVAVRLEKNHLLVIHFIVMWTKQGYVCVDHSLRGKVASCTVQIRL